VDHLHRGAAAAGTRYRLRYADPASLGHAPMVLAGHSVIMENRGVPVEVVFINAVRGFLRVEGRHSRSFTYTWDKTGPDEGEAILRGLDNSFTLLRLSFLDGQLGQWGMEDIPSPQAAALIARTVDAGAFVFQEGRLRRRPEHAALPDDPAGHSLLLNEAGRLTHVTFTSAATMTLTTPDGVVLAGKFVWDQANRTRGELRLEPAGGPPLVLALEVTAPGTGKFEEVKVGGEPGGHPPRNGTFTLPDDREPPPDPNCPPESLAGLSILISDSAPCTLTFNANGTGMQTKEVNGAYEVTTFLYSYSRTGGRSASVAITFHGAAGDLIDDYEMEFNADCTGDFQRESSANGSASGSTSGTFGPGSIAGAFPPVIGQGLGL
jgi:hypothetical protein